MSRIDPTPPLWRYFAFGLLIESDIRLRELEPSLETRAADLTVVRGDAPHILDGPGAAAFRFEVDQAWFSWRDVGDFWIRSRDQIVYRPRADIDEALVSLPLLGPVMGVFLQRRGHLTLHGSAVALKAGVAIFLGDKGAGKSTTAATLISAGKTLLTDDIVALEIEAVPRLHPAFPQVKLTQEASNAVVLEASLMARPHPDFEKTLLRLDGAFSTTPQTPSAAFVLERGNCFDLVKLSGADALKALMRFSYATRFGRDLITGGAAADHLRQCAALSRAVPVLRMIVPNDLDALTELPDWLEGRMSMLQAGPQQ